MTRDEKIAAFVADLNALCDRHNIHVTLGCGCCDGSQLTRRFVEEPFYMVGSVQLGGPKHFTYSVQDSGITESTNSDYMTNFPVVDDG
jgi:hypothetical protein